MRQARASGRQHIAESSLGYTLSPAGAGLRLSLFLTPGQGSRTRPGLHAVAHCVALASCRCSLHPVLAFAETV